MQLKTPVFCNGIRGYGFNIWSKGSKEKGGINSETPCSAFVLHTVGVRKHVQRHAAACLVYFYISAKCRAKSKQPMAAARTRIYEVTWYPVWVCDKYDQVCIVQIRTVDRVNTWLARCPCTIIPTNVPNVCKCHVCFPMSLWWADF